MRIFFSKWLGIALVLGCATALAQDRPADSPKKAAAEKGVRSPDADNTGVNVRDKEGKTKTPQKQSNKEADRKLLADVRRAITRDKSLSKSAHNVKIVAKDGVVTLRGPVRSDEEKGKVEQIAKNVAGVSSIENQLDVKTGAKTAKTTKSTQ